MEAHISTDVDRVGEWSFEIPVMPLATGRERNLNYVRWKGVEAGDFAVGRDNENIAGLAVGSMDRLLRTLMMKFVRRGSLTITTASGAKFTCGDGTGETVRIRFLTNEAERGIILHPELYLGETYMDGTFVVENG